MHARNSYGYTFRCPFHSKSLSKQAGIGPVRCKFHGVNGFRGSFRRGPGRRSLAIAPRSLT